jgi:hypothetical protein
MSILSDSMGDERARRTAFTTPEVTTAALQAAVAPGIDEAKVNALANALTGAANSKDAIGGGEWIGGLYVGRHQLNASTDDLPNWKTDPETGTGVGDDDEEDEYDSDDDDTVEDVANPLLVAIRELRGNRR